MVAAAMLVAMAVPAFAQGPAVDLVDLIPILSPEANAVNAQDAANNATQTQTATQNCENNFTQENNQTANATVNQGVAVGSPVTINQEQHASNYARDIKQENKCVAVIRQDQDLTQSIEQDALAAAAAALREAEIEFGD